ncbi:MAG: preprotein translocase subunit SecE [Clostridiales bacterium]|nr:preprotein translocase subunit SecE [Clostridiales bacterium]
MADKNKKKADTKAAPAQNETKEAPGKDAAKSEKAEKKSGKKDKKADKDGKKKKPNIFVRMGRGIAGFFKNFRGEIKKIVWPDRATVLRNTVVVLVVVLIAGFAIFLVDTALTQTITWVKELSSNSTAMITSLFQL